MKKVLIFITWVSVLGCNSYIFEDYFPLKEGNQWIYTDGESEFQSYVEKSDSLYHMVLGIEVIIF
uniref:Lipoprotein n=1 Tax=candidate division WOR-3 bacterium TaxID=2052148 RepID=A0A7C4U997_UNCW3